MEQLHGTLVMVTLIEMMKGIFEDFLDHKIIIFIFEATRICVDQRPKIYEIKKGDKKM